MRQLFNPVRLWDVAFVVILTATPAAACKPINGDFLIPGFLKKPSLVIRLFETRIKENVDPALTESIMSKATESVRENLAKSGYFGTVEIEAEDRRLAADLVMEGYVAKVQLGRNSFGLVQLMTGGATDQGSSVTIRTTVTTRTSARLLAVIDCTAGAGAGTARGKAKDAARFVGSELGANYKAAFKSLQKPGKTSFDDSEKTAKFRDAFNRGYLAIESSDNPAAAKYFRAASELDPTSAPAQGNLGLALTNMALASSDGEGKGLWRQAAKAYEAAIAIDGGKANFQSGYGTAYGLLGQIPEAERGLQRAAELDPAGAHRYYYLLAGIYRDGGDNEHAREMWLKSLRLAPKGPYAPEIRKMLSGVENISTSVTPEGDQATIVFYRRTEGFTKPSIFLDGIELARIKEKRYFQIRAAPGAHRIVADSITRREVPLLLEKEKTYYIKSHLALRGGEELELVDEETARAQIAKLQPLELELVRDQGVVGSGVK